jgi:hypothetical protein
MTAPMTAKSEVQTSLTAPEVEVEATRTTSDWAMAAAVAVMLADDEGEAVTVEVCDDGTGPG